MNQSNIELLIDDFIQFAKDCDLKINAEVGGAPIDRKLSNYLVICNFLRLNEFYQSIIQLASARIPSSSFVVLRAMVENYIHLHGCVKDESFSNEYIKKHLQSKKKRLSRIARDLPINNFKLDETERARLEEQQDKLLNNHDGKILPDTYAVFKRFNKTDLYHLVFAHCSLWVHGDSHTFHKYLIEENDKIEFCDYKDLHTDIALCLLMALKIFFLGYEDISHLLNREPQYLEEFSKKYNQFHDQFALMIDCK